METKSGNETIKIINIFPYIKNKEKQWEDCITTKEKRKYLENLGFNGIEIKEILMDFLFD